MSQRPLAHTHPDHHILSKVSSVLLECVGGWDAFANKVPRLIRTAIDEVIDAPRTNRFTLDEIEKTEKTYLGTKIEILLRSGLNLQRGTLLDLNLGGVEVDIKNTSGANWSIPMENVGHPALLIRSSEKTAKCDVGLIVIKDEYLNLGKNRDSKRGIAAAARVHIWWLLEQHPYQPNFWEILPNSARIDILQAGSATQRLAKLFTVLQDVPISRVHVQAVSQQQDYMKRIRRNGGARDLLAPQSIAILWGQGDRDLINRLNLGSIADDSFISHSPRNSEEADLLIRAGHIDAKTPP